MRGLFSIVSSIGVSLLASGVPLPQARAEAQLSKYCKTTEDTLETRSYCYSLNDKIVIQPLEVTTTVETAWSTRLLGRLDGGSPLFDQSYQLPFADPAVQSGVFAARAAITNAGGPGVIITGPTLIDHSVSSSTTSGPVVYTYLRYDGTQHTELRLGPDQIIVGDLTGCFDPPLGASNIVPICGPPETYQFTVPEGTINEHTIFSGDIVYSQTRSDTRTDTVSETYELVGRVLPVGAVHGSVQSASFDLAGRLLTRLPEVETNLWLEGYAMRVRHGDLRHSRGVAGGVSVGLRPGLRLVLGVDHGSSDVNGGEGESADLQLTEIGGALKLERGAFTGSLSVVYGFGSARSFRNLIGSSSGSYDLRLAGAAIDLGYALKFGGGWSLTPLAGVDHVRLHSDGFRESGMLGLIARSHSSDRTRALAGLEIGHRHGGVSLAASARYVALLEGARRSLPVAFALAPDVHLVSRGPKEPNTAQLGARARIELVPGGNLSLGYDARLGRHYKSHHGFLAFAANW
jgi:hypothetical protein